jgi:hypothetical protein
MSDEIRSETKVSAIVADDDDDHADDEKSTSSGGKNKHDSGAADLEKVTDFVEDREELVVSGGDVGSVMIGGNRKSGEPDPTAGKLTIRKEDVELIVCLCFEHHPHCLILVQMRELEVPRVKAEKKLREHRGNAKAAMKDLLGFA